MNRREFIGLLGAGVAWPVAAHAQQAVGLRRIGVLMASAEDNPQYQAYVGIPGGIPETRVGGGS